jgi:hypothetical protein
MELTEKVKKVIKDAAKKLTGYKRRHYVAQTTLELLDGNPRQAERIFGWGRKTVEKGLRELETGFRCVDNYQARGRKKTEEKSPDLAGDIAELVEPHSQAEPRFKNTLAYTRLTAKAVRQALSDEKEYTDEQLPCERTISNILNRLDYRLQRVQKTKPVKKIAEVDEIFDNVHQENQRSDNDPHSLRISIDSKAKLAIGPFSRNGKSRGKTAKKGADHDPKPKTVLVPFGILDVVAGLLHIIFCLSTETTDFIVDALQLWWDKNKERYAHIQELVINLDNGPHLQSHRTQFIKRMVEFADQTGLRIRLVYYPPYHSKYNPVEHCWGVLEQHWNGEILDSVHKAIEWTKTMTWKGLQPAVGFFETIYPTKVKVHKKALEKFEKRFQRSQTLPRWDVTIDPKPG